MEKLNEKFDFMIVGGGTAGCILASRLSEDEKFKILVLEIGKDDKYFHSRIPASRSKITNHFQGQESYPIGPINGTSGPFTYHSKILGGDSTINYLMMARGTKLDHQRWNESVQGQNDWSYENAIECYKKIEKFEGIQEGKETQFRSNINKGTKMNVLFPSYQTKTEQDICKSLQKYGLKFNPDYNANQREGISWVQQNIKNAIRQSSSRAFIHQAMTRKNCIVKTLANVRKILFDGNKAIGVECEYENKIYKLNTKKGGEVIISCGGFGSPKLLMKSGIGPEDQLKKFNIPLVKNMPVGKNYQDHMLLAYFFKRKGTKLQDFLLESTSHCDAFGQQLDEEYLLKNLSVSKIINQIYEQIKWKILGVGELSSNSTRLQVYYKSKYAKKLDQFAKENDTNETVDPDIHIVFSDSQSTLDSILVPIYLLNSENGYVDINSKSFNRYQQLAHEDFWIERQLNPPTITQCRAVLEALDVVQKVLDDLGFELIKPFGDNGDQESQWHDWMNKTYSTVWHPVATCKMGNDQNSVVNSSLKVKGIENLRVVDNSIIPCVTHGNTQMPALMIGQKASDMIKQEYLDKDSKNRKAKL